MASTLTPVADVSSGVRLLSKLRQQRDYVTTFATEIAIFLSQILLYRWIAMSMDKQSFSEFALARRCITLMQPLMLFGLTIALPRHLSYAFAKRDRDRSERLYGTAAASVCVTTSFVVVAIYLFARPIAHLLFGSAMYAHLLRSLTFMLAGIAVHALAYSYFRGSLKMNSANTLQALNLGVVPLLVFPLFRKSVPTFLMAIGICWVAVALCFLLRTPIASLRFHAHELRDLFSYGIQRVPGDIILMSLLTVPATFLAHVVGIQSAGAMAFGISFLTMFGSIFGPASLVLLPKTSRMIAAGRVHELKSHVRAAIFVALPVALSLTAIAEVFGNVLIRAYLGPGYGDVSFYLHILATASVPYALYCVLRGLIDAYYEVGINSLNLLASFLVFSILGAVAVVLHSASLIAWALVASLYVLCGLTLFRVSTIVSMAKAQGA